MEYPATLELNAGTKIANWRPLVHWILNFPHLFIAYLLSQVGGLLSFISWLLIVFTGRLPAGLANFQCLVIRYTARAYSYALWLREPYPPFDFSVSADDPGGDPLVVTFAPALEGRNRLTVGLRFIWLIPAAIFGMVLALAAGLVTFVSFFAVLFTGRYPEGMYAFMVKVGRYFIRLSAYTYLLVDEYPPFALE